MSISQKKRLRRSFNLTVFNRDKYQCVMCGKKGNELTLDAHHITDRNLMPNGGYVAQNGITLCKTSEDLSCHMKAEMFHATGKTYPGFSPEELYNKIQSSFEKACKSCQAMKLD